MTDLIGKEGLKVNYIFQREIKDEKSFKGFWSLIFLLVESLDIMARFSHILSRKWRWFDIVTKVGEMVHKPDYLQELRQLNGFTKTAGKANHTQICPHGDSELR